MAGHSVQDLDMGGAAGFHALPQLPIRRPLQRGGRIGKFVGFAMRYLDTPRDREGYRMVRGTASVVCSSPPPKVSPTMHAGDRVQAEDPFDPVGRGHRETDNVLSTCSFIH